MITAKKSSISTVVSGSERGVCVLAGLGGLEGDGVVDAVDGRRGRGGTGGIESVLLEGVVVVELRDVRDALRAWNGSSDVRGAAVL